MAKTFIGFARLPSSRAWRLAPARINGMPGCLILDGESRPVRFVGGMSDISERKQLELAQDSEGRWRIAGLSWQDDPM